MTSTTLQSIVIENRIIGCDNKPFVIAEMSGNHNQSISRCMELIDIAASAGVDALKIQTYTADTMTLDLDRDEFFVSDSENPWSGQSLHKLYEKAHTPWEWHEKIFNYGRKLGLIVFSSPFDESSVDFLETLNVPAYKVSSFEMTHIPLIRKIARTGKPMIISTGMASEEEIMEALDCARSEGNHNIILLKCTSTYPASPENSNILTIPDLREKSGCPVGLSDHTLGVGVAVASVALGACVIEKHFTTSRSDGGVDAAFSLEPAELRLLVQEVERAWLGLGGIKYGCSSEAEKRSLNYRRSIYVKENVTAGELLTADNLGIIRPGLGLAPKYFYELLGKKASRDLKAGTAMSWSMVESTH